MPVTAFKAACTCKLLLLPDRCMVVHLIMELVGNRSFNVTLANVTTPQEHRPTYSIYVLAPLLFNICISELPTTVSRKEAMHTPTT